MIAEAIREEAGAAGSGSVCVCVSVFVSLCVKCAKLTVSPGTVAG